MVCWQSMETIAAFEGSEYVLVGQLVKMAKEQLKPCRARIHPLRSSVIPQYVPVFALPPGKKVHERMTDQNRKLPAPGWVYLVASQQQPQREVRVRLMAYVLFQVHSL